MTSLKTKIMGICLSLALVACGGVTPEDKSTEQGTFKGGKTDQIDQCMPICDAIGSRSEGWYDSCTGELIGWAQCDGCEAKCDAIGSRSEGWYAEGAESHCQAAGQFGGNLIGWDSCASPDPKACVEDAECVAVNTSCCSCAMGGTSEAFNENYAHLFATQDCPPGLMCLAVYMCFGSPACVQGQCQMVTEPEPEPEPKTCGPFPGGDCEADEVCDRETCAIGGGGTCVKRPEGCFEIYAPVCGCDGKTYGNDCDRLTAGAALDYEGECNKTVCDTSKAYCKMMQPVCPEGQVTEVVNGCWGECVDITECSCDTAGDSDACPLEGFTCWGTTGTCGPYVMN